MAASPSRQCFRQLLHVYILKVSHHSVCDLSQVREQLQRLQEREAAAEAYAASSNGAAFPPPPLDEPDFEGMLLSQWAPERSVIDVHA